MCRFTAYIGKPILADELLFKPTNSLINQSMHAKESDIKLNGDGFGLGWYAHEVDYSPALYTSVLPAWNDRNLRYISQKIRSNCLLAHVRAASMGYVNDLNCHPFHYKRFLFMHNGGIGGFLQIKRHIRKVLSDEFYQWIKGQTDSEHFFALFLQVFYEKKYEHSTINIALALKETIHRLFEIQEAHHIDEPSYLNMVITDGHSLLACRGSTSKDEDTPTLHYALGSQYEYHNGVSHMAPPINGLNEAVLIASERLNNFEHEWQDIPINHALLVYPDLSTKIISATF
jgi:glutamine amidotransferase